MSQPSIQALIFDYGGVFSVDRVSLTILACYDRLLGWPSGTLAQRLLAGPAWEAASRGEISLTAYWEKVGEELEPQLPPGFARFREGPFAVEPLNPEVVDLAHQLKRRHRLALCSNALATLRADLEAEPALSGLFDVVIISAEVGLRKPDPRIFELTASRLGLPLAACLLIDDKPRNTIAAQAIGMPAIMFTSPEQLRQELAGRGLWTSSA